MRCDKSFFKNFRHRQQLLESQWLDLCGRYLPVTERHSIWRYSRDESSSDPEQGWKLHVAATVLSAVKVLQSVAPLLSDRRVLFKGPRSLDELERLNSGIFYGYSQVGKFLTIYPQTAAEAVKLARELHELTRGLKSPVVPFDRRYEDDSCVHYRYGGFKTLEIEDTNGERINALRTPDGTLVPDTRDAETDLEWLANPFPANPPDIRKPTPISKLQTTFRAFRALAQRGKGGVYQAIDFSVTPPRLCVIKQGRRNGEVSFDGRDGRWRVKHEKQVLKALRRDGLPVPLVYSSFNEENDYYLVAEFIEGENLEQWLTRRKRRLPVATALRYTAEIARVVARIHASGWVWRDCKPRNIIITKRGELRPLDFEGACLISHPDALAWGTQGYTPPEISDPFCGQQRLPEDLYALGVIMYLLLTGRPPEQPAPVPLQRIRKNVPGSVVQLVTELLDANPQRRPHAHAAAVRIETALKPITAKDQGVRFSRRARSAKRGSLRRESNIGSVVR
jgi:Protein kinase domain